MPFSRARYVAATQQFLVTFVVVALGVTAAGVTTLRIVAPETSEGNGIHARDLLPAVRTVTAPVATKAVKPTVHQVGVGGVDASARRALPRTGVVTDTDDKPADAAAERTADGVGMRTAVLTAPRTVHGYDTVGVTWNHGVTVAEDAISVQVRTEKKGVWSKWTVAPYHDDHGPDADSGEATAKDRPGTDPVVIGAVQKVQLRVLTTSGRQPAGMRLVVIDPGADKTVTEAAAIDTAKLPSSDVDSTSSPIESTADLPDVDATGSSSETGATSEQGTATAALSAMKVAPKPQIFSRAQWGADEKLREQGPPSYGTIKTGFIHHTVNANNYTAAQVPALIRGIYAYHVEARGWRDIGYNFLVDRFGRIWEGRYGGVDRAVVGAHTLGYNEVSFAMSAIGNFEIAKPPQAILDAYAKLFAWKLSLYNISATATHLWVKNRYLNAINGHRDVGQTACPGKYLYAKIPWIRTAARNIQLAAQTGSGGGTTTTPAYNPTATPAKATPQTGTAARTATGVTGSRYPGVVAVDAKGRVVVYPTQGQVGYSTPVTTATSWRSANLVAPIGDVTGDGRADVLVRMPGGVSRVYAGDGRGHVSTTGRGATKAFHYSAFVVGVGDWNRDGRNDVLAKNNVNHSLYLYPGRGNGTFGKPVLVSKSWKYFTTAVTAGDLDRSGSTDLVALGTNRHLYVMRTYWNKAKHRVDLRPAQERAALPAGYTGILGGGDLTGDHVGDLVLRRADGTTAVLRGKGNTYFNPQLLGPYAAGKGLAHLTGARMVGSTAPDLVGTDSAGHLVEVPSNGRTNLGSPIYSGITLASTSTVLDVGDWNGDGRPDLITRHYGTGSRLVLWRGLGNGTFGKGIVMGDGWGSVTKLTAVGDITGDGHPDLVGQIGAKTMEIFPGNGKTGFLAPRVVPYYIHTYNTVGHATWHTRAVPGSILTGAGGTFVPVASITPAATLLKDAGIDIAAYDQVFAAGDADGDGAPDLMARRRSDGSLWLIPGKPGTDGFGTPRFVAAGFAGYRLLG